VSVRHLDSLFHPASVAVVGASRRERSVGDVVMRNLLRAGFAGPILPVHPEAGAVAGVLAWRRVADLPLAPELGVVCTPPETVPGLVDELARAGARAVVVLTAGLAPPPGVPGPDHERELARIAKRWGIRVLGPNCVGVLVPAAGLNASFAHVDALAGRVALVAQSGAVCTAALDWAHARGIGFSKVVSLGNSVDVDVGDLLDYLGSDPDTHAILLYLEAVQDAREFLSAGRAASRNKPVVVVKGGRVAEGERAAATHTGALAGSDAVYDAAFRRAGMLRVFEIGELFDAVETLARSRPLVGDRLAIVGNGGGPGVLATDALVEGDGRLAELAPETLRRLDERLPSTWSRANPVDLVGDASGDRYRDALEVLQDTSEVDALLVLHSPTAIASDEETARATVEAVAKGRRRLPVLTSWLGESHAGAARRILQEAGLPTYETPERGVQAFLHLVRWRRNQEALMETPARDEGGPAPDRETARAAVGAALARGGGWLTPRETWDLLSAYGVRGAATRFAADATEAARAAAEIGGRVALKIDSPDVVHKSDVGGVALDLETPEAVADAARAMAARLRARTPDVRIHGFVVQAMADTRDAIEVLIGAASDRVFGPVVLFGRGGVATEVIGDRTVGLPPLNGPLARNMVQRTRTWRQLRGYRGRPPADQEALCATLIAVANILIDCPEVVELDLNPVLASASGALAVDARVRVEPAQGEGTARLAILPYPSGLDEEVEIGDGRRVRVRPIRPEDEPAHDAFFRRLSPDDVRFRFFGLVREMPHSQLARYTQIDYDREMAFIAVDESAPDGPETLGVVRAIEDPDRDRAEFAIIIRSDLKGKGLGHALLERMVRYCRSRGVRELVGQVLPDNRAMLDLAGSLGFARHREPGDDAVEVRLALRRRRSGS